MADTQLQLLMDQLALGFETLQDEYTKLFTQHSAVERKLATAREQYNELARLYGSGPLATPPLSLSSLQQRETEIPCTAAEILEQRSDEDSREASRRLRAATTAIQSLRCRPSRSSHADANGVRIWSGPAADKPEVANSSLMPSISESPLEQDFTIEGKPSRLGCPFASMSSKKLSSHAASVLSRYNAPGSGAPSTTPLSSVSRINGRDSQQSRRGSRRTSFMDPIKAEICGLPDHHDVGEQDLEHAIETEEQEAPAKETDAEVGVCPIRFLDQHSPEEVATYFQKHKHELPRSHEVCVRRYQSNEEQIRELDAKYGNVVSMIQGLGAKHKDYLPDEPDPEQEGETAVEDARSNEKVRKWATNVSVQAADGQVNIPEEVAGEEERQPHFERPLRDIRVGESPSRPWGISIPPKYMEHSTTSETSSRPVQITSPVVPKPAEPTSRPEGKCPFGFDKQPPQKPTQAETGDGLVEGRTQIPEPAAFIPTPTTRPNPIAADDKTGSAKPQPASMLFTGPVFIGYSAEDAARILRDSGMGQPHS